MGRGSGAAGGLSRTVLRVRGIACARTQVCSTWCFLDFLFFWCPHSAGHYLVLFCAYVIFV